MKRHHLTFVRRPSLIPALLTSSAFAAILVSTPAMAQDLVTAGIEKEAGEPIVVTGSRIRRDGSQESTPVSVIDEQVIEDRGYNSASDILNSTPTNVPDLNQADGTGASSGSGQQFPNIFGLGPGRTLTLVNGRRMVTTSSGLGDAQVDANIIPLGLLDRVEVVQGGGAAVYGSDAIAGVVNYILKDDFSGVELDAQNGISSRGDYHTYSLRGTAGMNFSEGRGNIAVDVGYSKSPLLFANDRPLTALGRVTQSNPANTGPDDGIPSVRELFDARFWPFNANGVVFGTPPAPFPQFLARVNGQPIQFAPDGSVVPYDPGSNIGIPFASGGEGYRYNELTALRTGVERLTANAIGHYDITDAVTLRSELLFSRTVGTEVPQGFSRTILGGGAAGPIVIVNSNPFLTPQARAALTQASPGFAFGQPLFLSKYFRDLTPTEEQENTTETYRGVIGVEGDFSLGTQDFYWSVSGSYARVDGRQRSWRVDNAKFDNAIFAVGGGGSAFCLINVDGNPNNDDPACAPINPFGIGNISEEAQQYVSVRAGQDYKNIQKDLLATVGGDLFGLPAGMVKFSLAYEHRDESADFDPLPANQQGLFGTGTMEVPISASYNTDEISGELLLPIVGYEMGIPLVRSLELSAAGRLVDNSIAGNETVWDLGARWETFPGVTLRGSRSRNFRAPTLSQLFAPSTSALTPIGRDPCDADRIASGPNPEVRRANCLADFQANPGYGVLADGSNAGASAEARLAGFQDPAENFQIATVTTGGNPSLQNEISDTLTYGIVVQPEFVPGLTVTADRIEIDLEDGLSPFTTLDFAAACYDNQDPDPAVCAAFTRQAAPDGTNPGGTVIAGTTTTFNAGVVKYRGEIYSLEYLFEPGDIGTFRIGLTATHNSLLTTSVTGETFVRTDNTFAMPDWRGRLDITWMKGPVRLSYRGEYLSSVKAAFDATIENNPNPILSSNLIHNLSAQFEGDILSFRIGVDNLFDRGPSYPQPAYGDILGRRFFAGVKLRY